MKKKLLLGFAPLVAIAALLVTPVAAQATSHYYSNGVLLNSEGRTFASWGTVDLRGETGIATGGEVSCHTATAGAVYNPAGGGPGTGFTEAFASYKCEGFNACEPGETARVIPESLPWPTELTNTEPIRVKTGLTVSSPHQPVRLVVTCDAHENTFPFEGSLEPVAVHGTSASHPGFAEYDAGSGHLNVMNSCEGEVLGSAKIEGEAKILGYEEQELINEKPSPGNVVGGGAKVEQEPAEDCAPAGAVGDVDGPLEITPVAGPGCPPTWTKENEKCTVIVKNNSPAPGPGEPAVELEIKSERYKDNSWGRDWWAKERPAGGCFATTKYLWFEVFPGIVLGPGASCAMEFKLRFKPPVPPAAATGSYKVEVEETAAPKAKFKVEGTLEA